MVVNKPKQYSNLPVKEFDFKNMECVVKQDSRNETFHSLSSHQTTPNVKVMSKTASAADGFKANILLTKVPKRTTVVKKTSISQASVNYAVKRRQ